MQGTAADIIKLAMLRCQQWIADSAIPARMIMQVHDELVFEVEADHVTAFIAEIRHRMSEAAEMAVPLEVEIGWGDNWDEAH